ncbi:MAG: galactokinase, partial [Planctomycetales bacterium]|nr:galactokinase [Planctomycetales bacterium]
TMAICAAKGLVVPSLELAIFSTVPLGGGLSSSAALEVATATLCEAISGQTLPQLEKVQLCQQAEHQYAQVPCGIMDQSAVTRAVKNHLLLLDCRSLEIELIPLTDPAQQIMIINSNVKHELGSSEYAARRRECEAAAQALGVTSLRDASLSQLEAATAQMTDVVKRRARHIITEIQRTQDTANALRSRDWKLAGELMYASHASLRDDYEVSCRELDLLVELATELGETRGVYGSRMTGGGFGGCTVSLVDANAVDDVATTIGAAYQQATALVPTIFVTRPATGACRLT